MAGTVPLWPAIFRAWWGGDARRCTEVYREEPERRCERSEPPLGFPSLKYLLVTRYLGLLYTYSFCNRKRSTALGETPFVTLLFDPHQVPCNADHDDAWPVGRNINSMGVSVGRAVDLGQMDETEMLPSRPNKSMDAMTTAHFDVDGECVAAQGRAIKDLADSHFEQVVSQLLELSHGSSETYHTAISVVDDPIASPSTQ